jgi:PIN domain nuclease of toxin-antitoxin system
MRLLLDTHFLIWGSTSNPRLSATIRQRIIDCEAAYFSAISIAEISIKSQLGKLDVTATQVIEAARNAGFIELPLTSAHATELATLPAHHTDPFDRMLIAQARVERITLITADRALSAYGAAVEAV